MNDERLNQYQAKAAGKQKALELGQKNLGHEVTQQGLNQKTFGEEGTKGGLASNRNNKLPEGPEQSNAGGNTRQDNQPKNDPRIEEMEKRSEEMDKRVEEIDERKENKGLSEPEVEGLNEDIDNYNEDVDDFNKDVDEINDDLDR